MTKAYWLTLDPATRELRAGYRATAARPPDAEMLMSAVAARGWTAEALDAAAVGEFVARCREAAALAQPVVADAGAALATARDEARGMVGLAEQLDSIEAAAGRLGAAVDMMEECAPTADTLQPADIVQGVVGSVIDGECALEITEDKQHVLLTLRPAKGGRAVRLADVRSALAEHGVAYGVDEETMLQLVEGGDADGALIASGIAPTEGAPTRFESLLQGEPGDSLQDENALVDYRALGQLVLVKAGMRLMRRIPGTEGSDGIDVFGQVAPAPPADDLPFQEDLAGVACDPADADVLVALIDGAPSLLTAGMSVNPVVEVDAVDLASGNIDFKGTLQVRGDVVTGMSVKVSGDVLVSGTVEAAQIDAGGNVVVKGGIVGAVENSPGDEAPDRLAHVTARGSIQARFIGNAAINAGKDVIVEREIRQSEVAAGDSVSVGLKGSAQGNIHGGRVRALRAVRAVTLGSMAGVKTVVQVGVNPHAQARREALQRTRKRLLEEKTKLEQLLLFLRTHPEKAANGIGERALHTHAKLVADLKALDAREAQLAAETGIAEQALIHASRKMHGGLELQVVNRRADVAEDRPGGTARLSEGKLIIR